MTNRSLLGCLPEYLGRYENAFKDLWVVTGWRSSMSCLFLRMPSSTSRSLLCYLPEPVRNSVAAFPYERYIKRLPSVTNMVL